VNNSLRIRKTRDWTHLGSEASRTMAMLDFTAAPAIVKTMFCFRDPRPPADGQLRVATDGQPR
jgi:hypothetical protein